jgi:branched-chain amino acid transport system ATP-binding protein
VPGAGQPATQIEDRSNGACPMTATAHSHPASPAASAATGGDILSVNSIAVAYGGVISALHDVSLTVPRGQIVALLGGNGAGKSTTLKAISTMLASERGKVTRGSITYDGTAVTDQTPSDMVGLGMVQVLEGRRCFAHLTVEENIISGAFSRKLSKGDMQAELDRIYTYFRRLKDRRKSLAGYTSGGEQQMTAVARAMMAKPRMLLLDEPSMGLAPQLVAEIFNIVRELNTQEKVSILLAEQNTNIALRNANYGYIIESGHVMMHGPAEALRNDDKIKEFYLGISKEGRKNFRDVLRKESDKHADLHHH